MALFIPTDRPIVDPRTGAIDFQWLNLFSSLANGTGNIPWANVDKTGSSLADLVTKSAAALTSGILPLARLSGITTTQLAAAAGILLSQLAVSGVASGATVLRGDSTWAAITKGLLGGRTTGTVAQATTTYVGLWEAAVEADTYLVCPVAGVVKNLYVVADGVAGAGQSFTYTMRKNAVDQTVTCSISGGAATTGNDTTHSFSVAAGDTLTMKLVTSATATARKHQFGVEVATA